MRGPGGTAGRGGTRGRGDSRGRGDVGRARVEWVDRVACRRVPGGPGAGRGRTRAAGRTRPAATPRRTTRPGRRAWCRALDAVPGHGPPTLGTRSVVPGHRHPTAAWAGVERHGPAIGAASRRSRRGHRGAGPADPRHGPATAGAGGRRIHSPTGAARTGAAPTGAGQTDAVRADAGRTGGRKGRRLGAPDRDHRNRRGDPRSWVASTGLRCHPPDDHPRGVAGGMRLARR